MAYDEQLANRIRQAVGTGTTSPNARCSVVSPSSISVGIAHVRRARRAEPT